MMHGFNTRILFIFVLQIYAKKLAPKYSLYTGNPQAFLLNMDHNLANALADRVLKSWHPHHADLDKTTLEKRSGLVPQTYSIWKPPRPRPSQLRPWGILKSSKPFQVRPGVISDFSEAHADTNKEIIDTFQPRKFIPKRFLENQHVQTILGSGAIESKLSGCSRDFPVTRERIKTSDGDFFDIDIVRENEDAKETVIILHGLESGPEAPICTRMAQGFLSKGLKVVIVAQRGCSGEDNDGIGFYHLGFTDDVDRVVDVIRKKYPDDTIFLSGFSMGGNMALKFLGEQGEKAWGRNLRGAAVFCVPFDLLASQPEIDKQGFNQLVYSNNFLSTLKAKAEKKYSKFGKDNVPFDIEQIRKAKIIGDFDEAFVAPVFKFRDKEDYYIKSSSKQYLPKIVVPVVAINAKDDPFMPESSLPSEKDIGNAPVKLVYHNQGGHCGFLHSSLLDAELRQMNDKAIPEHGFIAEEMARAIQHMRDAMQKDA